MQSDSYLQGRILVVDDEAANTLLLKRMLMRAGYTRVLSTEDSREAVPLVVSEKPDLVLLDLMMPHLDGYEVMRRLSRELPADEFLPILVLTADATPQALQRALSSGAKDFLTKPFDQTELLLRVKNLLETRYLYRALQQQLRLLEGVNEQASQAMSARDRSLSSISHDMGQPLAAMRLTLELVQDLVRDSNVPEKDMLLEDLATVFAASEQMTGMIAEISDMARLQMGRDLVLHRGTFDVIAMIRSQVQAAQGLSRKHRLILESTAKSLQGSWDKIRITRVVSNLLSNAVKFSPKGGDVRVSVVASEEEVSVSVTDNGLGIPEVEVAHVLENFYRASNVVSTVPGTGIGLAGVKQIVDQHGGAISIQSTEGQGTIITFTLPLN